MLPELIICIPFRLSKGKRLPFKLNYKHSLYPLDLIHGDLWGPTPISFDGYLCYFIFLDDCYLFTWFYPLKTKIGFYHVLMTFIKLMQTQFSTKD